MEQFWDVALVVGIYVVAWILGYFTCKWKHSWKKAGIPEFGELILDGQDLYFKVPAGDYSEVLHGCGAVTVRVSEVKRKGLQSAEKTTTITEQ